MAQKTGTASTTKKPKVTTLPITSPAATLGLTGGAALAGPAAFTGGIAPPELDPLTLIEHVPPALPAQPDAVAALVAPAGAPQFSAFAVQNSKLPPVPITYDVGNRTWLLLSDYSCPYREYTLTAKAGYAFDLSSIPRPIWWLLAPNELSIVAPLFHDLLYEYRGRLPDETYVTPYRTFSRSETDTLFLDLMEQEGVDWFRRNAAYSAVRAAGGLWWVT
ncbi:DUF1353 domain-containing protein [Gemmata sp. JC717]|uniref:DUF1353 domain-containing protein n=1 Tax=Gemmata algarum TaxID=2975278 RepID=UPI0021BB689F|nr:DUF1353 domain-containing protein [Gemmata algarum]MDY3556030.1 DUF1353 domain-containing protein [Gemmata algarum]